MRRSHSYRETLTPRERQVLELIAVGLTNEEIAERLQISFGTAKYHVSEILSKFGVASREEAALFLSKPKQTPGALALLGLGRLRLPCLPKSARLTLGVTATVAVLTSTALVSGGMFSRGSPHETAHGANAVVVLDLPSDTLQAFQLERLTSPFKQTILLTKGNPTNVGDEGALVSALPRLANAAELQAVLSDDIELIVVDQSALPELLTSDVLRGQLAQGRALMGINVTLADLHRVSDAGVEPMATIWETSPSGETSYKTTEERPRLDLVYPAPPLGVEFFSFLTAANQEQVERSLEERSDPRQPVRVGDDVQINFTSRLFEAALTRLNAGGWDVRVELLPGP